MYKGMLRLTCQQDSVTLHPSFQLPLMMQLSTTLLMHFKSDRGKESYVVSGLSQGTVIMSKVYVQ